MILASSVTIPGRTLAVVQVDSTLAKEQSGYVYEIEPNHLLMNEQPNVCIIPNIHKVDKYKTDYVPFVAINLLSDSIYLPKGEVMGFMHCQALDVSEIVTGTSTEPSSVTLDEGYDTGESKIEHELEVHLGLDERKFITSPADIDMHGKVDLQDAEVTKELQEAFKETCNEYRDIFSVNSGDIGKTPLLEMKIDNGDSPLITQKPYTLPLKHAAWVQKELEILEKAGVIVRSVSPWASPIVVVPKRSAPGEPPKRRLCMDYRAVNNLLPPVKKVSKAKGVLTLVPLPKIDEIYARLKGSRIYLTFDMRRGYYHITLSERARPKTAFVSAYGKWEFKRCPFGLAQAPAYFQRLVNEVLSGLDFIFGYLDDFLVFSLGMVTHLQHLRCLFERLRAVDLKLKEIKCNFLKKKAYIISRTYCIRGRYNTFTGKTFQHQNDAPT